MARDVKSTPADSNTPMQGNGVPDQNAKGYHTGDIAADRLCMLNEQSVRMNQRMAELLQVMKNMLDVQMNQSKTLDSINDRLLKLEHLDSIDENIKKSTQEIDILEDVMRDFSNEQRINTNLLVEQSHEMIEVFKGTDGDEARSRAQVAAEEKRREKENQS